MTGLKFYDNMLIELLSLRFNNSSLVEAASDVVALAKARVKGLILPVNVDQIVTISSSSELAKIYESALRIYADGMPLVWLSKLKGTPLKQRVTGSDLTPEICRLAAAEKLKVFFFGAAPGVASAAAEVLMDRFPELNIVGTYSPPFGFEKDECEIEKSIARINEASPDILFLALGFPKQEQFAYDNLNSLRVGPIVSIGATLDFIAGNVRRAPSVLRESGFEWLWRLCQEPRRLWHRYLVRGPRFFVLAAKELIKMS